MSENRKIKPLSNKNILKLYIDLVRHIECVKILSTLIPSWGSTCSLCDEYVLSIYSFNQTFDDGIL